MMMFSRIKIAKILPNANHLLSNATNTTSTASKVQDVLPFSKVPKIPTIPFLGSTWTYWPIIGKYDFWKLHKAGAKKHKEYGPIVQETFSRDFSPVSICEAEDIAKVFRAEGRYPIRRSVECLKKYRNERKDVFKIGGLAVSQGEEWYKVRSEVQPHMMKPKAIHSHLGGMDQVAGNFIDRVVFLRKESGGEVPELLQELYKWAIESIGLVALDTRFGCLELSPNPEATKMTLLIDEILAQILKLEFSTFNLWKKVPTPTFRKFCRNMDYFTDTIQKYLTEANKRLKNKSSDDDPTFLELMLSTAKDPQNVNATITDMFIGGIDTTASTVAFTLYHLARNPAAQNKLYQEIQSTLKEGKIDIEALNNLRYLKACVKESQRFHPVTVLNNRKLNEDVVLSGYSIPAGTYIFLQGYQTGHDEKHFPEPKKFMPERFLRSEISHEPFAFLPFGFGPRACIGKRIAEQEVWTLLTRLVQRFRIEYHHEDIDLITRIASIPDKPLRFQFFDR